MRFGVILLPTASDELDEIVRWISKRSPDGARNWLQAWDEVIDRPSNFANICQLAPERGRHKVELRQIIFKSRQGGSYRALFVIRDNSALILHLRGQGQDLMKPREIILPDD